MTQFWIIIFLYLGLITLPVIDGHTDAEVQLRVPRYVERGSSATLECIHDVEPIVLFKVSWFRDEVKFFEYVKGRKLPFKNFTLDGADIDWEYSNESQVTLANVDFKLSGQFHCEVSMTSPLYTKASSEHLMSVFLPQTGPPVIRFRKRSPVAIGERLFALCNTTRARPAPHITWLINGKKVDEKYVRTHHVYSLNGKTHRRSQQQQEQELEVLQAKQKKEQMSKMPDSQPFYSQQQQQYNHIYQLPFHLPHLLTDRYDKSLRWSGNRPMEDLSGLHKGHHHDGHHHGTIYYNNPFSALTIMHDIDIDDYHEIQHRNYDNKHMDTVKKHFDMKKHRNSSSRKYRHINDNALGIIRSTLNSGGFGPEPPNLNNNLGLPANAGPMTTFAASYGRPTIHASGSSAVIAAAAAITDLQQEKGLFSVSQLNVELTEQHVDISGRMEITCLATIPSAVGPGEQFADYKTYSIKLEVGRPEKETSTTTSSTTPSIGMAALGNGITPSSATTSINARDFGCVLTLTNMLLVSWLHCVY
ncbi:uncharacterized protein LOC119641715 [Glossina fuscipes]|uniref:Uncharacterized protein LOC119641715 n=1 Tax=Glossina fuscipes TaxID=7396 RepID=A0A9C5ZKV9_9MUSC|nr:uncharacterized protein LOC119641715 [Glossina fuscipes]XP_037896456.1 uncharacterized protein LOC119641715 [Glossina fuscipes]XP_037896457.1 uncharacterized protein LOC119641715 [Glossina fuscipes]